MFICGGFQAAFFFALSFSELARSTIFTLEMWIGPSRSTMAPLGLILSFALMFLDEADALDDDLGLFRKDLQDPARGTAVISGNNLNGVAAFDVEFCLAHRTSGAREMIFMKFFSRSSRATGPKMRVPRGLRSLSMITMALLSKRR